MRRLLQPVCVLAFVAATAFMPKALASTSGVTYQGRILKPDSTPLSGSAVQFKMQVRSPGSESCLMYEEQQTLDLHASNGVFAITINDGSGSRTDTSGLSIDRVFANYGALTFGGGACAVGNAYSPNPADGRKLQVYFKDETMATWEPMPSQNVNFVPFAFEAKQVAGFTASSLVRVAEADGTLDTVSPLSNANYTELLALVGGTSAQYAKQSGPAGTVVATAGGTGNVTAPAAGSVWLDTVAGNLKFYDGATVKTVGTSGGSVSSVGTGAGLTGGPITSSGTISLATLGAGGTGYKVTYDIYGRVTAAVALVEADIPALSTAGKVLGSAITSGTIGGSTAINTTGTISSATNMVSPQIYGSSAASGNIKIDGTSNTTSGNVLLASAGGNVGIGTAAPTVPFTLQSSLLSTSGIPSAVVSQSMLNDAPPNLAGFQASSAIFSQPNPASNSTAQMNGILSDVESAPASALNIGTLAGLYTIAGHRGTGTASNISGLESLAGNSSTGTTANQSGLQTLAFNGSTGLVGNQNGAYFSTQNQGAGTVSNQYGVRVAMKNSNASGTVTNRYGVYISGTNSGSLTNTPFDIYASDTAANNYLAGNVGIGTTSPRGKLEVSGAMIGSDPSATAGSTVDFSTGNLQYTTSSCGSFQLNYLKSGASYSFAVQGATSALCSFTAYSDAGVTPLTVHLPPGHGVTVASTHTLYTLMVMGTHVYVSWITGY